MSSRAEVPVALRGSRRPQQRAAPPSSAERSAPTSGAQARRRAAWWKRGSAVDAAAVGERERAVAERRGALREVLGFDAPSRKEKALRQRSST